MIINAYSVRDEKAEAFLQPFFMHNDAVAQRAYLSSIRDTEHEFSKHPEDYTLYRLAEYDDQNGTFKDNIELVMTGKEALSQIQIVKIEEK